jgi:hypothetical protein
LEGRKSFCPDGYPNRIVATTQFLRWAPSFLSNAEVLLMIYLVERTITYGKASDASSRDQITGGIYSRTKGEWIRGSSGLSETAVKTARRSLV